MSLVDTVSALTAGGTLRKQSRFTRLQMRYPSTVEAPWTPKTGIPTVTSREVLDNPIEYSISAQDTLAAATLTMSAANDTTGVYSDMVLGNDILQVEERYDDGAGSDTGWFRVGTFLVDSIAPSADKSTNKIDISCRDVLKWLTFSGLEIRFWADTIKTTVRLAKKVDPYENDTTVYVFVDGHYDAVQQRWIQTTNWSDRPLPRVYNDKGKRISGLDGSLQIEYGIGEILIDTFYYDTDLIYGGLGKPPYLTATYARFCDPTDEREVTVTAMPAGDTLVLDSTATAYDYSSGTRGDAVVGPYTPAEWAQGLTVVVLTGQAKNARFRVKRVDVGSRTVVLDRDASLEGLTQLDRVRLGEGNRLESVIERLFLAAGFQNLDPDQPFYVSEIVQTQPQVILPTVADFDYTESNRTDFMRAYQAWQAIIPPYTQLFADAGGNLHHANTFQKNAAQYSVGDAAISGSAETSDAEIVTRVIYQVRNRKRLDLCATGVTPKSKKHKKPTLYSTALKKFTWLPDIKDKFITIYPSNIVQVDPSDKGLKGISLRQRVLFDRQGVTGIQIANIAATGAELTPHGVRGTELDGKLTFMVEFDRAYRLGEIHLRGTPYPYGSSSDVFWQIEYSLDGNDWLLLGDEFALGNGPLVLTAAEFQADNIYAKFLRLRLNSTSKFQTAQDDTSQLLQKGVIVTGTVDTRTSPPVQIPGAAPNLPILTRNIEYASLATFAVYEYDIVQDEAELGVDRFDYFGVVASVSAGQIITNVAADPSWEGKSLFCNSAEFVIDGVSGNTLTVQPDPVTQGVGVGAGFIVLEGESDADFNRDVLRRQRLGRRTRIIDTIDEVGFYIVETLQRQGFDYTLEDYCKDKAKEFLGELSREFFPISVKTVRPDAKLRDTLFVDLRRLGFQGNVYARQLTRPSDGSVEIKATPFRDVALVTPVATTALSTTLTTTPPPDTTTTTTDTTTTTTAPGTPTLTTTTKHKGWH